MTTDGVMTTSAARIEDLEEALRRIVTVLAPERSHQCCVRDSSATDIALDALGLDPHAVPARAVTAARPRHNSRGSARFRP